MADNCQKYFGGRFQELFDEYDAGYVAEQHCGCHICELAREEIGLPRCINNSCDGCKNLASGKKIRNFHKDLMGE